MKVHELISRMADLPDNLDVVYDDYSGVDREINDVKLSRDGFTVELVTE